MKRDIPRTLEHSSKCIIGLLIVGGACMLVFFLKCAGIIQVYTNPRNLGSDRKVADVVPSNIPQISDSRNAPSFLNKPI